MDCSRRTFANGERQSRRHFSLKRRHKHAGDGMNRMVQQFRDAVSVFSVLVSEKEHEG